MDKFTKLVVIAEQESLHSLTLLAQSVGLPVEQQTKIAVMAFGKRKFHRIISQLSLLISCDKSPLTTSFIGIETEPKLIFTKNKNTITKSKMIKRKFCFLVNGMR